jgi:DNA-binding transcriptional LysR family regulator
MLRKDADTDSYIGRRIKLRDLQILFSVAELGSMAKAASQLSITQPSVSQAISDLEEAVGVRLFDRSTHGVALTRYGEILLKSGLEAFDALRQAMRSIKFMATPDQGDVWIGCAELALHAFVPAVIERVAQNHPGIVVHAVDANPSDNQFDRLRARRLDLLIGAAARMRLDDDIHVEIYTRSHFVSSRQPTMNGLIAAPSNLSN